MRIQRVRLRNFKGATRAVDLTGDLVVVDGPNGSGKTAILQAVSLALTGDIPGVGKREIKRFASGELMSVAVVAGDGAREIEIERSFSDEDGERCQVRPSQGERSLKACEARIRAELGDAVVAVNLKDFLDLSPGKKGETLSRLVGARSAPVGPEDLLDALRAKLLEDEVETPIPAEIVKGIRSVWTGTKPAAANLDACVQYLSSEESGAEASERTAKAAVASLTSSASTTDVPETSASLNDALAAARKTRDEIKGELAADEERARSIEGARQVLAKSEAAITTAKLRLEDRIKTAKVLEERCSGASSVLQALKASPEPTEPTGSIEAEEIVAQSHRHAHDEASAVLRAAEADLIRLRGSTTEAWSGGTVTCPVVGAACPSSGWVCDNVKSNLAEIEARVATARARENEARELLCQALDALTARRQAVETAWSTFHRALEERRNAIAQQDQETSRATAELAAAVKVAEALKVQLDEAHRNKAKAEKALGEAPGRINTEEARTRLGVTDATIADLEGKLRLKERAKGLALELEKAKDLLISAAGRATLARKLTKHARTITSALIEKALAPVVESVRALLAGVRPEWQMGIVGVTGGIDLLAVTGTGRPWTPWSALSGGEAVIFGAALAVALARLQPGPARFLLLEAAELDATNFGAFLETLAGMASDLSTVIVATCHAGDGAPEPWHRIVLGGKS